MSCAAREEQCYRLRVESNSSTVSSAALESIAIRAAVMSRRRRRGGVVPAEKDGRTTAIIEHVWFKIEEGRDVEEEEARLERDAFEFMLNHAALPFPLFLYMYVCAYP